MDPDQTAPIKEQSDLSLHFLLERLLNDKRRRILL